MGNLVRGGESNQKVTNFEVIFQGVKIKEKLLKFLIESLDKTLTIISSPSNSFITHWEKETKMRKLFKIYDFHKNFSVKLFSLFPGTEGIKRNDGIYQRK